MGRAPWLSARPLVGGKGIQRCPHEKLSWRCKRTMKWLLKMCSALNLGVHRGYVKLPLDTRFMENGFQNDSLRGQTRSACANSGNVFPRERPSRCREYVGV